MIVKVLRQKPGGKPHYESYAYHGDAHVTVANVLDSLNYNDDLFDIEGKKCDRIVWECSCQQKLCGACGMRINKIPALACGVFIDSLKGGVLTLEPLTKFQVIEDLMVDKSVIFDGLRALSLWLDAPVESAAADTFSLRYDCAKCLKCGLCLEACPNYLAGKRFFGPAMVPEALNVALAGGGNAKEFKRYFSDGCSKSGACQSICPARIPTLSAIAAMYGVISKS